MMILHARSAGVLIVALGIGACPNPDGGSRSAVLTSLWLSAATLEGTASGCSVDVTQGTGGN